MNYFKLQWELNSYYNLKYSLHSRNNSENNLRLKRQHFKLHHNLASVFSSNWGKLCFMNRACPWWMGLYWKHSNWHMWESLGNKWCMCFSLFKLQTDVFMSLPVTFKHQLGNLIKQAKSRGSGTAVLSPSCFLWSSIGNNYDGFLLWIEKYLLY